LNNKTEIATHLRGAFKIESELKDLIIAACIEESNYSVSFDFA